MAGSTSDVLSEDMDYDDEDAVVIAVDESDESEGSIQAKAGSNYDKVDSRRKIELYWEKRRLKEEFGDIEDFDLDF